MITAGYSILPDSVTEENIKEGISVPRNKLLFDNAKFLLPYTGIGSGIMRVLQRYDKIFFKNNFVTEEFVITMMRDEKIEGVNDGNEGVNGENDTINSEGDTVNGENERVNEIFERVNDVFEGVKDNNEGVNKKNERVKDFFERVKDENERVKNELMQIYSFIEQNPLVKINTIEKFNKKSNATNRRYLKILKDNGLIEYIGSDKTGGYKVITKNP